MARKKLAKFAALKGMGNVFEMEDKVDLKGKWEDFFGNDGSVVLEIGCGTGAYTNALAERFAGKNFIGIDRKGDRIWRAAKDAARLNCCNVAFLKIYGEDLMEYFGEGEVDEIWITFPDPYPKPSKAGQRLCSSRFLEIYKRILRKGGAVHLKTDFLDLFEFGVESAKKCGFEIEEEVRDVHGEGRLPTLKKGLNEVVEIMTLYEKYYVKEGRKINYTRIKKK